MFGASVFESFQTKILVTGASNHKEWLYSERADLSKMMTMLRPLVTEIIVDSTM